MPNPCRRDGCQLRGRGGHLRHTGLLARPGDPRSLAGALEYALDHPVEMDRMAGAALELVNARCRSDLLGEAFAHSYELALGAAGVRASRGSEAVSR